MTPDGKLELVPGLAESWKAYNETAWVFQTRKGVKFQKSGEEVTAYHIAESIQRTIQIGRGPWAYTWYKGIQALDKNTLLINAKIPYPVPMIGKIWHPINSVEDMPALKAQGQDIGKEISNPSGTGPFKFKVMIKGERIEYERNPNYWRGAAKLDRLIIKPIPDAESRVIALETGVCNLIDTVPPAHAKMLEEKGFTLEVRPTGRVIYGHINTQKPPFDDLRVRQAANYAIDREAMCKKIFLGYYKPAYSIMETYSAHYVKGPYSYNPEKAKQLLKEAGYKGEEIVIWGFQGRVLQDREMCETVAAYLREAGFNVKLDIVEWGTHTSRQGRVMSDYFKGKPARETEYNIFMFNQATPEGDADPLLYTFFKAGESWNIGFYNNTKVNQLFDRGRQFADPEKRNPMYQEIVRTLMEDAAGIWLYHINNMWFMDPSVRNVKFTVADWMHFDEAYLASPQTKTKAQGLIYPMFSNLLWVLPREPDQRQAKIHFIEHKSC